MARPFRRTGRGVEGYLHDGEADLLRELGGSMLLLLAEGDPADPAVDRLFPAAYRDDDAAAAEFRDLVLGDLRETKRQSARALAELPRDTTAFTLDDEAAEQWLLAFNDLRLTLGARLGITDDDEDRDDEDPAYELYDFLTALQASLIDALSAP